MPNDPTRDAVFEFGAASPLRPGQSWFFGIGINQYQHFSDLNNAVKDVKDLIILLQDQYDLEPDHVLTLFDQEATRRNIIRTLDRLLREVQPDDKLLLYYSGHGHLMTAGKNQKGFWIPTDAEKDHTAQYIRNSTVREYMEDIQARHTLLISDSCFSGSLFVRGASRADTAIEELEQRASRWAICSGRHDEEVYDGPPGANSPFAESILDILRTNRRAKLNVAKLADRVVELTRANYKQLPEGNPLYGVGHKGGQYIFRLKVVQPAWETAWQALQQHPEDTLHDLQAKILLAEAYIEKHEKADNIEEAYQLGERLEQKREFFLARNSIFRLKRFVKKKTPYQAEAQERLAELKEGFTSQEESSEEQEPAPKKDRPKTPRKKSKPQPHTPTQTPTNLNTFTDPRDGQTYKTVELNGQIWMAENLNYDVGEGCYFYDDDPKNGEKYGRLYTWEAVKKACPPGWRLPTEEEWWEMAKQFGGVYEDAADESIAACEALFDGGLSGFDSLLGGLRDSYGNFFSLGHGGHYWSSTEEDAGGAWSYIFDGDDERVDRYDDSKMHALSCRCLRDDSLG